MRRYIVLFSVLAILAAGCAQQAKPEAPGNDTQPPVTGSQPPASGSPQPGAEAEFNECISETCGAGEDNLTKICKVSCWDDYAVATKDPAKCDKNLELINSSIGYNVCIEAVAKSMDDASPCGLIKGEFNRDLCYVELAQYLDDPAVCDKVDDTNVMLTKQDCLNAVSGQ